MVVTKPVISVNCVTVTKLILIPRKLPCTFTIEFVTLQTSIFTVLLYQLLGTVEVLIVYTL